MTINKIENLKRLRDKLEYRNDIDEDEYIKMKEFYDINIKYWEEVLLSSIEEE